MIAGAAAGSDAVILNAAVIPVGLEARNAGLARNYMLETAHGQQDPAAPYVFTGGVRAETPLAPVHFRARRNGAGDIVMSWIRRSRVDADDWAASEIPLDESEERYRLEIRDGGMLLRQVEVADPSLVYTADEQLVDFGAAAEAFSVRLFQLGRKVPLGIPLEATVSLPN